MNHKFSLVIAQPNYLLRRGVLSLLQEYASFDPICELEENGTLFEQLKQFTPDYVVIDVNFFATELANLNSSKLFRPSKQTKYIGVRPLTTAAGYTESEYEDILQFFDLVVLCNDTKQQLGAALQPVFEHDGSRNEGLTQREKDIVRCIAQGLTNKEIGEKLFISPHTVITHRKNITKKLEIKSVSGLTVYAIINNLVSMDEVTD